MNVNLKWMLEYLGITRAAFYKNIKAGLIPLPEKTSSINASWDKEEITRLFPNGWRKIPDGGVTRKWMCKYFGIKNTCLYLLIKKGAIPDPIRLSQNKCYWMKDEIIKKFPGGKE